MSCVYLCYSYIFTLLNINNELVSSFCAERGVRQGCPLSGALYALSLEPLLNTLCKSLSGFTVRGLNPTTKIITYADEMCVYNKNSDDNAKIMQVYRSLTKLNQQKSTG